MQLEFNKNLKSYNTFGIEAFATAFVSVHTTAELKVALALSEYPKKIILSGGSNMLITQDIDALVIHISLKGITIISETDNDVCIEVMAGENWHNMVLWTLEQDYGGLENLSLIPGNTGTAPIQNIGAYGVELKDSFLSCTAIHRCTGETATFDKAQCQFGYRDSIFKSVEKDNYVITSVQFKLTKKTHQLRTEYGAIANELTAMNCHTPTIQDVSKAVIEIRKQKLPDPAEIGNSGSFFKNPVLSSAAFSEFHRRHENAPFYSLENNEFKVPAGWLIEQCGFKGKRFGDAGVHTKQALVLVNYGNATGTDIMALAQNIQDQVLATFGITIVPEVNIIK